MRKRNLFFILLILFFLVIAGFVFFFMPGNDPDTPVVALATPQAVDSSSEKAGTSSDKKKVIAVSPETVQTVISTLHRAESYSRTLDIQDFWSGGKRDRSVAVFAKGNSMRLDITGSSGTLTEHYLLVGAEKWVWYSDSSGVFHAKAENRDFDQYQSIITYEDVLAVPAEDILEADYREYYGKNCIFIRFRSGTLGYESECYIDPSTGLLMAERSYDGDFLFYSMDSSEPDISTPDDSVFLEPYFGQP